MHLHHLNVGIVLLAAAGGTCSSGARPGTSPDRGHPLWGSAGSHLRRVRIGLHLEDEYWQRASYDAVGVIGISGASCGRPYAPRVRRKHWATVAGAAIVAPCSGLLVIKPFFSPG